MAAYAAAREHHDSKSDKVEADLIFESNKREVAERPGLFEGRVDLQKVTSGWANMLVHISSEGIIRGHSQKRDEKAIQRDVEELIGRNGSPLEEMRLYPVYQAIHLAEKLLDRVHNQAKHAYLKEQPRIMLLVRSQRGSQTYLHITFAYQKQRPTLNVQLADVLPNLPLDQTFYLLPKEQTDLLKLLKDGADVHLENPRVPGAAFTFRSTERGKVHSFTLHHSEYLEHPVQIAIGSRKGSWPVAFTWNDDRINTVLYMQDQVERSYGLNLKTKVLKSPIVWVVDWSEEAKQLHLDISRGPMTAGVVLADMPSRPTGNYDEREFNSKYLAVLMHERAGEGWRM
jgi:hypothetical protein